MKGVELHGQAQRAVYVEGLSSAAIGIDPRTAPKMLTFSLPPDIGGAGCRDGPGLDRLSAKQQHMAK